MHAGMYFIVVDTGLALLWYWYCFWFWFWDLDVGLLLVLLWPSTGYSLFWFSFVFA